MQNITKQIIDRIKNNESYALLEDYNALVKLGWTPEENSGCEEFAPVGLTVSYENNDFVMTGYFESPTDSDEYTICNNLDSFGGVDGLTELIENIEGTFDYYWMRNDLYHNIELTKQPKKIEF